MMVTLSLLVKGALFFVICASLTAKLRGLSKGRVTREAAVAVAAGATSVLAGICCYAIGTQSVDEIAFRNAGAACFLVFPILAVIALNIEARRRGFGPGSSIAAFLFGVLAVGLIGRWATYSWKGPRGGWEPADLLVFAFSVVLIYSSAACVGWWCGRSIRQKHV